MKCGNCFWWLCLISFIIAFIGCICWVICAVPTYITCPNPDYPSYYTETCSGFCDYQYWCLPLDTRNTSKIPAVIVNIKCDWNTIWMWLSITSLIIWIIFMTIWMKIECCTGSRSGILPVMDGDPKNTTIDLKNPV